MGKKSKDLSQPVMYASGDSAVFQLWTMGKLLNLSEP